MSSYTVRLNIRRDDPPAITGKVSRSSVEHLRRYFEGTKYWSPVTSANARKFVKAGLVTWVSRTRDGTVYVLTDAGRAALAAHPPAACNHGE